MGMWRNRMKIVIIVFNIFYLVVVSFFFYLKNEVYRISIVFNRVNGIEYNGGIVEYIFVEKYFFEKCFNIRFLS